MCLVSPVKPALVSPPISGVVASMPCAPMHRIRQVVLAGVMLGNETAAAGAAEATVAVVGLTSRPLELRITRMPDDFSPSPATSAMVGAVSPPTNVFVNTCSLASAAAPAHTGEPVTSVHPLGTAIAVVPAPQYQSNPISCLLLTLP